MTKLISHRGKLTANDSDIKTERDLEKKLFVIQSNNIMIELDFWIYNNSFKVGHDKENSFNISKDLIINFKEVIIAHIKNPLEKKGYEFFFSNNIEHFVHTNEPIIFSSKANPFCHSKFCNLFKDSKLISLIMPEMVMSEDEILKHDFKNPFILTECIEKFF